MHMHVNRKKVMYAYLYCIYIFNFMSAHMCIHKCDMYTYMSMCILYIDVYAKEIYCVYLYVYVYTCMYIYLYVYIYICEHVYI